MAKSKASGASADRKKPGGRSVGNWRAAALNELGGTASDQALADRVNSYAREMDLDYATTAEEISEWRRKQQRGGQSRQRPESTGRAEPTLSDLLAVKEAGANLDRETIQAVADLARRVGGLENLRRCIKALEDLQG